MASGLRDRGPDQQSFAAIDRGEGPGAGGALPRTAHELFPLGIAEEGRGGQERVENGPEWARKDVGIPKSSQAPARAAETRLYSAFPKSAAAARGCSRFLEKEEIRGIWPVSLTTPAPGTIWGCRGLFGPVPAHFLRPFPPFNPPHQDPQPPPSPSGRRRCLAREEMCIRSTRASACLCTCWMMVAMTDRAVYRRQMQLPAEHARALDAYDAEMRACLILDATKR